MKNFKSELKKGDLKKSMTTKNKKNKKKDGNNGKDNIIKRYCIDSWNGHVCKLCYEISQRKNNNNAKNKLEIKEINKIMEIILEGLIEMEQKKAFGEKNIDRNYKKYRNTKLMTKTIIKIKYLKKSIMKYI